VGAIAGGKPANAESFDRRSPLLSWAPATLADPVTYQPGTGYWRNDGNSGRPGIFSDSVDVILKPNAQVRTGRLIIEGGRRIRDIGGKQDLTETKGTIANTYLNVVEDIFIEGKHIVLSNRTEECDAFQAGGTARKTQPQTKRPQLTMQNVRIEGLHGTYNTLHADGLQNDYATSAIRMDRVTITTNYQALFLRPASGDAIALTGDIDLRRCNFRRNDIPGDPAETTKMTYFAQDESEFKAADRRILLTDVWIEVESGVDPKTQVSPSYGTEIGEDRRGRFLWWPRMPTLITDVNGEPGKIYLGVPPEGDFAPEENVGLDYISPGYMDA
jgi:hypothetical protein